MYYPTETRRERLQTGVRFPEFFFGSAVAAPDNGSLIVKKIYRVQSFTGKPITATDFPLNVCILYGYPPARQARCHAG